MGRIVILDELTANKIAAGEVVERPASVVKELVENSIDAEATSISVEIRKGGISYIKVSDNGRGIDSDDVVMAFEKHGTSKIRTGEDLDAISTMGFRGEALASISAVAKVELTTKTEEADYGTKVVIHGGNFIEQTDCGCPVGTTFVIRDLFFNTPARYNFLKKDATEAGHIIDLIERLSMARPDIAFKLTNQGSDVLRTPGNGDLKSVLFSIYGRDVVNNVKKINYSDNSISVTGFAGNIKTAISGRSRQSVFINGRYVKSRTVTAAIDQAYKTLMMKGKNPFVVLKIELNPRKVDVNVHPTKMEVRFSDEQSVFRSVLYGITNALFEKSSYTAGPEPKPKYNSSLNNSAFKETYETVELPDVSQYKPASSPKLDFRPSFDAKTDSNEAIKNDIPNSRENHAEVKIEPKVEAKLETQPEVKSEVKPETQPEAKPVSSVEVISEQKELPPQLESRMQAQQITENKDAVFFKEAIYIGQAFNTYLILQYHDEIVFMDQHAAHERVLFEELKKNIDSGNNITQVLLAPVAIELTKSEYQTYEENKSIFTDMGFDIDGFGENTIIIRSLPSILKGVDVKALIIDSLRNIIEDRISAGTLTPEEELYDIACKAAIKANTKLDVQEVKSLLNKMQHLDNPFTCPHGRPLTYSITRKELEKRVKRIQ